jgi:dipeptidyl-peptidase-4
VAYVDGGDMRVVGVDGTADRVLVGEAVPTVSWGRAEFTAAEEMERIRGFWWAPDGSSLLAARVDEAPVATWWIGDPAHPDQPPQEERYPAAGAANADVTLWLIPLDGDRREIRWDRDQFPYLGRVAWSAAGPPLLAVVSRNQRRIAVLSSCSPASRTGPTASSPASSTSTVPAGWSWERVRSRRRSCTSGRWSASTLTASCCWRLPGTPLRSVSIAGPSPVSTH